MVILLEWQRRNSSMFRARPQRVMEIARKLQRRRLFGPIRTNVGSHLFVEVGGCLPGS